MKINIAYTSTLWMFLLLIACQKENVFEQSPTQRSTKAIADLRAELTEAEYGWAVTYFPKTDSLLYSNPSTTYSSGTVFRDFGYGGSSFWMKFHEQGTLQMLADYDRNATQNISQSEFQIKQSSSLQLSFTTYTYIHKNPVAPLSSDILYIGKDLDGRLLFRTPTTLEPATEYIAFEKIKSVEAYNSYIRNCLENRLFFNQMENPQLRIYRGGRVFYESDYLLKFTGNNLSGNSVLIEDSMRHRYWAFVYDKGRGLIRNPSVNVLGSGYTGTSEGLMFRAGLRYNANFIFYDFQRKNDRFVSELVKVYEPLTRTYRYTSKHLVSEIPTEYIEDTGIIAEIWDAK